MSYYNPNYYQSYQPYQQPQCLNGRVVESAEIAKVSEVPIGSYAIFPKADLSEIYMKSWNNNGTTSFTIYKMEEQKSEVPQPDPVMERLDILEQKIEELLKRGKINEF